jgi:unsaturated rhamnogalacturonyl hydrolase
MLDRWRTPAHYVPVAALGRSAILLALVGAVACSSSSGSHAGTESGGAAHSGGSLAAGGTQPLGGSNSTGGASVSGGTSSTGDITAAGGNAGAGGVVTSGGTPTAGGSQGIGGATNVGGTWSSDHSSASSNTQTNTITGGTSSAQTNTITGGTWSSDHSSASSSTQTSKLTGGTTSTTGGVTGNSTTAANAPNPSDILAVLKLVTAYEIQLGPEDLSWVNKWTEATFYIGVMAEYLATNDSTYLTDATNWATKNNWTLLGSPTRSADNQCAGQVYEDIYLTNPTSSNSNMVSNTKTNIDVMVASPKPGIVKNTDDWWWCDALFMAPGAVARLGKITGQASYYSFLDTMWAGTQSGLFDTKTGLFWRDSTFVNGTVYWSRGNGWVMAGIVRVLQYLPATDASYSAYTTLLSTMAAAIKPLQQSDGTWHSDLTHPSTYPNPEVSGTGLITYALAYGINQGLLDRATYQPVVFSAWKAITQQVNAQGRVGYIQATGSAPAAATATETHDYGVGAFVLAGSEIYKMVK